MVIKNQIRSDFKNQRKEMNNDEVNSLSEIITDKIISSSNYRRADIILAYSSIQNEVNLSRLIQFALEDEKKIFLPKVEGNDICFYKINSPAEFDLLKVGSFNILEPEDNSKNSFDNYYRNDEKCMIFVPGIVFSTKGARIGFGKGFYDRFLSSHEELYKIGVCYDWQINNEFVSDEFDINMNMIITDKREVYTNDKLREYM